MYLKKNKQKQKKKTTVGWMANSVEPVQISDSIAFKQSLYSFLRTVYPNT